MDLPSTSLQYLRTLTDCTGVMQHGTHSVPNRRLGYTTDDNARALIVAAQHYERTQDRADLDLAVIYLDYLHYAQNAQRRFRNVMNFERVFLDEEGTQDCFGRTMWGCGYAASSRLPENIRVVAKNLMDESIAWVADMDSPRARAYSMLGMCDYLRAYPHETSMADRIGALADSLVALYKRQSSKDWNWYETYLTYGNAILPLGMLAAAEATGRKTYLNVFKSTIEFLTEKLIINGRLEIIGNNGWFFRDKPRAYYDQQTIDAGYTVYLYARAYEYLKDSAYLDLARTAHSWFFGNNIAGVSVYDPSTSGCYDAITPNGVNLNMGSESCICFLLAQMAMEKISNQST